MNSPQLFESIGKDLLELYSAHIRRRPCTTLRHFSGESPWEVLIVHLTQSSLTARVLTQTRM